MKLKLLNVLLICSISSHSSHIVGGEISITHLQGIDYQLTVTIYDELQNIVPPPTTTSINVYQKSNAINIATLTVPIDTIHYMLQPNVVGCGGTQVIVNKLIFKSTIQLDAQTYSHQSGYLFVWAECCRNPGIANLQNPSGQGSSIVTHFPSVIDSSANSPLINSSPVLTTHIANAAFGNHPFQMDVSAIDPDGDSLVYALYTPFENNPPMPNATRGIESSFTPVDWFSGYSDTVMIQGVNGQNLAINPVSGILSVIPNLAPAYFAYGIKVEEYRAGQLIGTTFRDLQLQVNQGSIAPNLPPQIHLMQSQPLANWFGDTLIFSGSPVCINLGVTDPNTLADLEMEVVYTDYDTGDVSFLSNYGIINFPDTFRTALCFQPDSFMPNVSSAQAVALNPGCYDLRGDTLPFFFQFVGYSNAGWGGNHNIVINPTHAPINLFNYFQNNPNPGGTWVDLDNSGALLPDGTFYTRQIWTPGQYRILYIDQQLNYPPDTGMITLNFVYTSDIESERVNKLNFYPNPAQDLIHFNSIIDEGPLSIWDLQGREVMSVQLEQDDNTISVAHLQEGIYICEYQGIRSKFIIRRN